MIGESFGMRYLVALLVVILIPVAAAADLRLASPFGSHMVLQRDKPLPIWGTADAGADVTIALDDRHAKTKADTAGRWSVTLEALPAGGPLVLTATANGATVTLDDVLIGDVFLCSGQSNMQYGLGEAADFNAIVATSLPRLRLGKVGLNAAGEPKESFDLKWQAASPAAAKEFSALAYCMAYELYRQDPKLADVPIGMLQDCMGATVIESWLPKPALAQFEPKTLAMSMFGIGPSALYNGMIAPLGRLPLAGVVWYQGEGNAGEPARYGQYLPLLIGSWREQLAQPELPFLIVQLPDYAPDWGGVYWQWIRESQAKAATAASHAGYVVTINTNDGWDLHPQGKHEIARRLAMLARELVYHQNAPGRSPTFKSAKVDGHDVRVTFDTAGSTLTAGAGPVDGFALAGDDGVYHTATAVIDGPDTVVVSAAATVPQPSTVRYAWAGVPRSTLSSAAGLPAAPFRTDDQPVAKSHGEIQQSSVGYVFKSPRYRLTIDGEGRATSLVVGYKQLLSNADAPWGGTSLTATPSGTRHLSQITPDGPDALLCKGGDLSANLRFADDAIHWSIANRNRKDAVRFTIALSPQVEIKDDGAKGEIVVRRRDVAVTFSNIDRVTTFKDPAADVGGKVLEVTIPPGETRTVDVKVAR
jgi:sialate O-acetylesterase